MATRLGMKGFALMKNILSNFFWKDVDKKGLCISLFHGKIPTFNFIKDLLKCRYLYMFMSKRGEKRKEKREERQADRDEKQYHNPPST